MERISRQNHTLFLIIIALAGWAMPGAGYFLLGEDRRAGVIFFTVVLTFLAGIYIGSIGVVDPVGARPWYVAQVMVSPLVGIIGHTTAGGMYPVYGRPNEIGQIYTGMAGLLNLLCIVNSVHMAHMGSVADE
jgi:hypothetical protein